MVFLYESLILLVSINTFNQKRPLTYSGYGNRLLYHESELGLGKFFRIVCRPGLSYLAVGCYHLSSLQSDEETLEHLILFCLLSEEVWPRVDSEINLQFS